MRTAFRREPGQREADGVTRFCEANRQRSRVPDGGGGGAHTATNSLTMRSDTRNPNDCQLADEEEGEGGSEIQSPIICRGLHPPRWPPSPPQNRFWDRNQGPSRLLSIPEDQPGPRASLLRATESRCIVEFVRLLARRSRADCSELGLNLEVIGPRVPWVGHAVLLRSPPPPSLYLCPVLSRPLSVSLPRSPISLPPPLLYIFPLRVYCLGQQILIFVHPLWDCVPRLTGDRAES